jgi:hypothetical protein
VEDAGAPYSLYEWDGNAGGAMRRLNVVFAKKMKPEGITRGSIGGRTALIIVDDGGGFQVVRGDNPLPYAGVSRRRLSFRNVDVLNSVLKSIAGYLSTIGGVVQKQ